MLTEIFKAFHKTYRDAQKLAGSLAHDFSVAVCPAEFREDLEECYRQSEIVTAQVNALLLYKKEEMQDLAELFEIEGEFKNFSDLMRFWEDVGFLENEAREVDDLPFAERSMRIFTAAEKFNEHFEYLPPRVRWGINRALSLQKDLILRMTEEHALSSLQSLEM